jgi:uncharacterized membrane protein
MSDDAPAAATADSLPEHIEEAVAKIGHLHARHRQDAPAVQRAVERLTGFFSRPRAAGLLTLALAAWLALDFALAAGGRPMFDPPPFSLLQILVACVALYMTVFILITQRREDELSELRGQLTLELAMLSEQKAAKIIALIEELRRDLPSVIDRHDAQAHAMAQPADPEAVMEALKETRDGREASGESEGA